MNKKAGVLKVILIIFMILLVVIGATAYYFYEFHAFKTVRLCIGEAVDFEVNCSERQDCIDYAKKFDVEVPDLSTTPEFIQEKLGELLENVVFCDGKCNVKNVRGFNVEDMSIEVLDFCYVDEEEFLIEIKGKDALEVYRFFNE